MHMLTGKWKIVAKTPLGEMDLVADFKASDDATTFTGSLNVYDVLKYDVMVITKDAVSKIEEVYA